LAPPGSRAPGARPEQLADLESRLGLLLPSDYKAFLGFANGWEGFYGGVYLRLDGIEVVAAENHLFRSQFAGLVAIGGDGGLETFALDSREGPTCRGLVAVDRNSPDPRDIWPIGPSFCEALQVLKVRPDGPWQG
jgi:hypothetical protein